MAAMHGERGAQSPLLQNDVNPETQAIMFDPFDTMSFNTAVRDFHTFRDTVEGLMGDLATAPALARDAYWSFEQPVPVASEGVSAAYRANKRVLDEIMETGNWRQLHTHTAGDPIASAIATMSVLPTALSSLDEKLKDAINQIAQAETELERLLEEADAWRELAEMQPHNAAKHEERAKEADRKAQQQQQQVDALAPAIEQAMEQQADGMRMAARGAMDAAQQEIENLNSAMDALSGGQGNRFGLGGSGTTAGGAMNQKIELARRMRQSGTFQRVMKIAGRFQRIALATQKSKVDHAWEYLTGIEMGNDLSRIVPAELALADDPLLGLEFDRRYLERQLFQYRLKGNENVGRGPIVVMLDDSGSMQGGFRGETKEIWAKGAMLGMLAVAKHQKRDLVVLHFSGASQIKAFRFLKEQQTNQADMLSCIELFFGGGTDLEAAMRETLKIVDEATFKKADVMCISDGITAISESMHNEWARRRTERDMRCYSILIGTREGTRMLMKISNEVLILDASGDDTDVLKSIFSV